MVGAAVDEAANNLTLNPRGVHQSIEAKMMEKHMNQSALSLLPTYKAFHQKIYIHLKRKLRFHQSSRSPWMACHSALLITLSSEDLDMFWAGSS